MAVSIVQSKGAGVFPATSVAVTPTSNVTAGNLLVAFVRGAGSFGTISSISSALGLTYTLQTGATDQTTQDPYMTTYTAPVTVSGAETFTANWIIPNYAWIRIIELTGQAAASFVDATDVYPRGAGTALMSSNTFSTTTAGIVLCAVSQGTTTSYIAGTDFTLISGIEGDGASFFGGTEYYVTSGALTSYTATLVSGVNNAYTMSTIAIKAAGGGGSRGLFQPSMTSMGVQ